MSVASSKTETLYGSTLPRIGSADIPQRHLADASETIARRLGYEPAMPWQFHAMANLTALSDSRTVTGDRRFAAMEGACVVSRQNGKTDLAERRALLGLYTGQLVLHTAHNLSLPMETFEKLVDRFIDLLPPHAYKLDRRAGREKIMVPGGGVYRVRAPKRDGSTMRGGATDLVIVDEYREFATDEMVEAAKPRMLARTNPQILYLSNAGGLESEPLRNLRARALDGDDGLCWLEWSAPMGAALDDTPGIVAANPAIGYTINLDVLDGNRLSMSETAFRTEHLCQFLEASGEVAYPLDEWRAGAIDADPEMSKPVVAIDTDPMRRLAVAVAAYKTPEGFHVGTLAIWNEPLSDSEMADNLIDLCKNLGTADVLLDPYTSDGIALNIANRLNVSKATRQNIITAGAATFDLITAGKVTHLATDETIDRHIAASTRKPTTDGGWRISRKGADPIPAAVAATLALWAVSTTKAKYTVY